MNPTDGDLRHLLRLIRFRSIERIPGSPRHRSRYRGCRSRHLCGSSPSRFLRIPVSHLVLQHLETRRSTLALQCSITSSFHLASRLVALLFTLFFIVVEVKLIKFLINIEFGLFLFLELFQLTFKSLSLNGLLKSLIIIIQLIKIS